MAFPVIDASQTSTTSSNGTSHTVTLPTYSSGHLLIVGVAFDGVPTITWPSGWTAVISATADGSSQVKTEVRYRVSDGSEGSSISITTSASEQMAACALAVTGYDTTTPCVAGATFTDFGSDPEPPNSNPGSAADYKWIEGFGADDDDETATYWSTSYTGIAQVESNTSSTESCQLCLAHRDLNASAQNPGGMHQGAEEEYVAFTFAIKPGAGAPGGSFSPVDPFGTMGIFGI